MGWHWQELSWAAPVDVAHVVSMLRQWAADGRSPRLVLETCSEGDGVRWRVGCPPAAAARVQHELLTHLTTASVGPLSTSRGPMSATLRLRASTRHRALRVDGAESTTRAVLACMARVRVGERLVLQVVLGPRRVPLAIPVNSPASTVQSVPQTIFYGDGPRLDGEKRSALRAKVAEHGFACTVRLGVHAASAARRQELLLSLVAAVRTSEAAGVVLRGQREPAQWIHDVHLPWRWPLRLNVAEVACLLAWPIAEDLPGMPAPHPAALPVPPAVPARGRILGEGLAPATKRPAALTARDALQHLHLIGPTGVGKSTLMLNLITRDIHDGRGVVVIDPKGDLVDDVLGRIPESRRNDVVVLDPSDTHAPVGLNPLQHGGRPELAVDAVLAVFHGVFADAWGPRTQDVLHAGLLTLARRPDANLVMLPLLLTNPGFRRSLTQQAVREDPIALGTFWNWYDNLSEGERAQAIAPVLNKLRSFLLRPSLRNVLGQAAPKFALRQVFTERKILLVALAKGLVGSEAAALLGSLVVGQFWQLALSRAAIPPERRHPVMVYVDELQDYLHLPTDVADVLAQARGLGVGLTLAHQHLGQLGTNLKAAVLANARSRVAFAATGDDAVALAARSAGLLKPDDFTALGRYQAYASLMVDNEAQPPALIRTLPPIEPTGDPRQLRSHSRTRFGRPLSDIEAGFASLLEPTRPNGDGAPDSFGRRPRRSS